MNSLTPQQPSKIKLPLSQVLRLIYSYAYKRILVQFKAVIFITLYLAFFQLWILQIPIRDSITISAGIIVVALGLAAFLEGLFLAIMPLGELCGLHLPGKVSLKAITIFSLVIGITATLAEPAISFVQSQGAAVLPWRAPMLYYLLNEGAYLTVGAIAFGVGISVVIGMMRFLFNWSLKPFLYVLIPLLLGLTWFIMQNPKTVSVVGLAWDTGGVTTGPVTVPLVLALGIGISRIAVSRKKKAEGFGVVTLASTFPILFVFLLALILSPHFSSPMTVEEFFSQENKMSSSTLLGITSEKFDTLAAVQNKDVFEFCSLIAALGNHNSNTVPVLIFNALRAILPLAIILFITITVILKKKIPFLDEVIFGLFLTIIGLIFFNVGMKHGLNALGVQTGESLPYAYRAHPRPDKMQHIANIDPSLIITAVNPDDGQRREFVPIIHENTLSYIPFSKEHYNPVSKIYEYIPVDMPIWYNKGPRGGYVIILLFMFVMGVGATMAEPSLNALGRKLEEMTGGAYKGSFLIKTVAFGVGIGMVFGFARILFDFPIFPLLVVAYSITLILTAFSDDEFTAIAWDSAGVTTGPITVPLVIATGVGIGSQAGVTDSFGVIASASVFPILTVLLSGIIINHSRTKLLNTQINNDGFLLEEINERI